MIRSQAVLVPTEKFPETPEIKGHDFNTGRDIDSIMQSMFTTGFQATALGQAVNEINRMVRPHVQYYNALQGPRSRVDGLAMAALMPNPMLPLAVPLRSTGG